MRQSRQRRRSLLRLALLVPPALFWAAVFAAIAGGSEPLERAVERAPDAAQVSVALACPLLAVLLGLSAQRRDGYVQREGLTLSRVVLAAGVALFVFAVCAALRSA
jgi:hypothetical protein